MTANNIANAAALPNFVIKTMKAKNQHLQHCAIY